MEGSGHEADEGCFLVAWKGRLATMHCEVGGASALHDRGLVDMSNTLRCLVENSNPISRQCPY